jgi:hypothetical protein
MAPDTDLIGVSQAGLPGLLLLAPCFSDNLLQLRQFLRGKLPCLTRLLGNLKGAFAAKHQWAGHYDFTESAQGRAKLYQEQEVHFTPEQEAQLAQLATNAGTDAML